MTAEDKLQAACVTWFRMQYPHLTMFAIPNGGNRNAVTGAMLKKTGTLAGVADLFLMCVKDYSSFDVVVFDHGLFIEMKTGKNGQTASQKAFQQKAEDAGYRYAVCRTFDEFKQTIEDYLT